MVLVDAIGKVTEAWVAFERDDMLAARRIAADAVSVLQAVTPHGGAQELFKSFGLHFAYSVEGRAEYQLGDFAAAERSEVRALEASKPARRQAVRPPTNNAVGLRFPPGSRWPRPARGE